VSPGARLGQHFLTKPHILERIVAALEPAATDIVLEIGAGRGSLTAVLASRVGRVIAIERDRRLAAALAATAPRGVAIDVVTGDALRLDWHGLVAAPSARAPSFKIIGNIPYQITSPLIAKALTPPLPERVVFLVQAEVAARLAAAPGSKTYGALSVGVQALCRVERLFAVRAAAFHPPPRVASAVVRLVPLAPPLVAPEEVNGFRAFVAACFSQRRKQLHNVVSAVTGRQGAAVGEALSALALDPRVRPESLAPPAFVRLWQWSARS
jgi:16S rRNA (adenine1518-N6/adenine1519-N6)-dimethyltransferase